MQADLVVVGASFAGLACAREAALAGLSVVVLEKKARAGDKLHTTGLIVKDAVDSVPWLAQVPAHLVRRIEGVRLYAPNLRHVDLQAPGYYFWATDAPALMDWLAQDAGRAGVEVRLGTLFTTAQREDGRWTIPLAAGEVLRARYLVGADGPQSRVAKALGLSANRHFLFGIEHEYPQADIAPGLLHCFISREVAPGYIGWAFQGVGVAQVGVARRYTAGGENVDINAFLAHAAPHVRAADAPSAVRAGMIPCGGLLPNVACDGALLVGDAAGMVSPVTAGGIHTALAHGAAAGRAVAEFVAGRRPDPATWLPETYPRFRAKRALRWLFDHFQADWTFNLLLGTAAMRRAAELVYFHRKGGVRLQDKE